MRITAAPFGALLVLAAIIAGNLPMLHAQEKEKPAEKSSKPAAESPDDKAEAEKPKTISDMKLPEKGTAEDYEKFLDELMTIQPRSQADFKKLIGLVREASTKVTSLEKDKESTRYRKGFELKIQSMALGLVSLEGEALSKGVDEVLAEFKGRKPDAMFVSAVGMISQMLEQKGESKKQIALLEKYVGEFEASDSEEVKNAAKGLVGILRRSKLPGNEMLVKGTTLAGKEFNVTSLKGKVVLVDFWATWCGPCRAEHPNMARNYKAYKDKGFEIVGVSLDEDREALEEYVKEHEVPWITLNDKGGKSESAEYYGINGIPAMFLIGKDGKVVSTEARGEELTRLLGEMLGPPAEVKEEEGKSEKPEEKKAAPAKEKAPK